MATITDIAIACGVAKSTVSNVINAKGHVSEAVRLRVLQVVNELGYSPSQVARNLALGRGGSPALLGALPAVSIYADADTAGAMGSLRRELTLRICEAFGARGVPVLVQPSAVRLGLEVTIAVGSLGTEERVVKPALDLRRALGVAIGYLKARGHATIGLVPSGDAAVDAAIGACPDDAVTMLGAAASFEEGFALAQDRGPETGLIFTSPSAAAGYVFGQRGLPRHACRSAICLVDGSLAVGGQTGVTSVTHDFGHIADQAADALLGLNEACPGCVLGVADRGSVTKVEEAWSRSDDDLLD